MDEKQLELAEALAASAVDRGISKIRASHVKPKGFDGTCECGEVIPKGRIAAEYYNCIDCQRLIEHNRKMRDHG